MRLVYATEMRFLRGSDGVVRCPTGQFAHESGRYAPFLEAFDEVMVFARVFDGEGGQGSVTGPGVTVFPVPAYEGVRDFARRAHWVAVAAHSAAKMADVGFCRVPGIIGGTLAKACWALRVPYAAQVIGDPAMVLAGHPGAGRAVPRILAADLRWVCKHARAATYVTRDDLQARYPPGVRTDATWFSDIDLGPEAFVAQGRRWAGGRLNVVAVGKLEQHYKGMDVLVDATALLAERGLDVQVRVVGDGKQLAGYADRARSRGVADRVRFLGSVPAGEGVRAELDRADLFVMPSRTEGLPRALIEAMARGLPAVASRVGGIPQLLDDGVLVPAGDAVALADRVEAVAQVASLAALADRNLAVARSFARSELEPIRVAWYRSLRSLAEAGSPPR